MQFHHQQNFNETKSKNIKKKVLFLIGLVLAIYLFFNLVRPSHLRGFLNSTILASAPTQEEQNALDKNFPMPAKEPDRWDVLIFGIGGVEQSDGPMLTDSIILFSLDQKTGKSNLISIPRDTYVDLPTISKGKINEIYEKSSARGKPLELSKEAFSRLTGVYIDNLVVFDFKTFKEVVDTLGGVDINLDKSFEEKSQWGYTFSLPAGPNHLDGQNALYYVRSRFSSSDFDRSRRQQQIILAIKNKAFGAGVLSNPLKLGSILKSLNRNIVTDLNIFDTGKIIKLANSFNIPKDELSLGQLTTDNILSQTFLNDSYILLPQNNDWTAFRNYFHNLLN